MPKVIHTYIIKNILFFCILFNSPLFIIAQKDSIWENILIQDKWGWRHDMECDSAGRVYLFSAQTLHRSTDNGNTWHSLHWADTTIVRTPNYSDNTRPLYSLNNTPVVLRWNYHSRTAVNDTVWEKSSVYKDNRIDGKPSCIVFPKTGMIWWVSSGTTVKKDSINNISVRGSIIVHSKDTCRTWSNDLWTFENFFIERNSIHSNGSVCLSGNRDESNPQQKMVLIGGRNDNNIWDTLDVLPKGTLRVEYCNDKLFAFTYATTFLYDTLTKEWNKVAGISGMRIVKKNSRELFMFSLEDENEYPRSDSTKKSFGYSSDGGYTWQKIYCDVSVFTAVIVPNGTLFGVRSSNYPDWNSTDGVNIPIRSTDNGKTWHTVFSEKRLTYVESVSSMPNGVILACADDVFRSTDEGDTWQSMGLSEYPVKSAVEAPDGTLYASLKMSHYQKSYLNARINYGICIVQSKDKGQTWTDITPDSILGGREPSVARLSLSPSGSLFAYWGAGILRRSKEGKWNWVRGKTMSVRCENICFGPNKTVIAVSPSNRYGTNDGVWYSPDDGITWTKHPYFKEPPWDTTSTFPRFNPDRMEPIAAVYDPIRKQYALMINVENAALMLYSTDGKKFEYRDESREHWGAGPESLTCDSLGNYYYNQTVTGIRTSTDGGKTWPLFSKHNYSEFPGQQQVIISPSGYLWSGEFFTGLFRSKKRFPPVGIEEEENVSNSTKPTITIAPNPADKSVKIEYDSDTPSDGTIVITDIVGNRIMESKVHIQAGKNNIELNTSELSTGAYSVSVITLQKSATLPLMIIR